MWQEECAANFALENVHRHVLIAYFIKRLYVTRASVITVRSMVRTHVSFT